MIRKEFDRPPLQETPHSRRSTESPQRNSLSPERMVGAKGTRSDTSLTNPSEEEKPKVGRIALPLTLEHTGNPCLLSVNPINKVGDPRAPDQKSNYELFNCSNFNIRYWSWNYRGCWHQSCPPIDTC